MPSQDEFQALTASDSFMHYPPCEKKNILSASDTCYLSEYGGFILENPSLFYTAQVDFETKYRVPIQANDEIYELLEESKISYYEIDGSECIVLDATAGKFGYPGYDNNLQGNKTAIDPITKEYRLLN